jgi:hypothetical protein
VKPKKKTATRRKPVSEKSRQLASLRDTRGQKDGLTCQILELRLHRLRGDLVNADLVRRTFEEAAIGLREALLAMARNSAPQLAGLTDPKLCYRLLEAEIEQVCREKLQAWKPAAETIREHQSGFYDYKLGSQSK